MPCRSNKDGLTICYSTWSDWRLTRDDLCFFQEWYGWYLILERGRYERQDKWFQRARSELKRRGMRWNRRKLRGVKTLAT